MVDIFTGLQMQGTPCRWRTTNSTTTSDTYLSMASRENVRLGFLLATLNELKLVSADIGNAYINAKCREQIATMADPDMWMRPAKRKDGSEYNEYIISYVDDLTIISQDTKSILEALKEVLHQKYF